MTQNESSPRESKAEIIVKQQYTIDATGDHEYAVPEVLLLGNRTGLRRLGEWLLELADRIPKADALDWDPDDHQHLSTKHLIVNSHLSDEIEFRIGILTELNRDQVLDKYGIDETSRQSGDLVARFRHQADIVEDAMKRHRDKLLERK
jgi:hypothetical protein